MEAWVAKSNKLMVDIVTMKQAYKRSRNLYTTFIPALYMKDLKINAKNEDHAEAGDRVFKKHWNEPKY